MNKLIQTIEMFRQKLPTLRRHSLKETPTRTIIIDPLLEALGWNVRDPDEVQMEYPTVDGKSVDYAMKLNKRAVLLIEAKALDDKLDDVKAVTQVVGYAANDGIVWCVLTNGIKWRVYRSVEKCPAPDKLMFEVSMDPDDSEGLTVQQIAKKMWRFSAEEMARGTLDALGEQTFTDGKVRKALQTLMMDPPRPFLNLLRKAASDESLRPQRIKDSLFRIASEASGPEATLSDSEIVTPLPPPQSSRMEAGQKAWRTRQTRAKKGEYPFDEMHHTNDKPQESVQLYQVIDRFCFALSPGRISKRYLAKTINYDHANQCFASVHLLQGGLRVWLKLKFSQIEHLPLFSRDVSGVGHYGTGDVELRISNRSELDESTDLIRLSFEAAQKKIRI